MKIFLYSTSLAMGGAEQQCARLASALKELHGYDVEVIVTYPALSNPRLAEPLRELGIPIHGCSWKSPRGLFKMYRLLRAAGRNSVLLCYNTFPDFIGGLVGRLAGLKKIYGSIRSEYLPGPHILMDRLVQRFCLAGTIFNSFRARETFVTKYHFIPEKSLVISNSIPVTHQAHDYNKAIDTISVITVGTFKPPKDYETWLKVIQATHKVDPRVCGVIVGYGWQEPHIRQWIDELKLNGVVKIVNGKGATNIPQKLARADIYLSTSILEGTSNSIMEGLRAGIPVVATDVGDNSYLIQDGESGYICPTKDVAALSRSVVKLCQDPALRQRMGERAKERMRTHHSIEHIVSQYKELING